MESAVCVVRSRRVPGDDRAAAYPVLRSRRPPDALDRRVGAQHRDLGPDAYPDRNRRSSLGRGSVDQECWGFLAGRREDRLAFWRAREPNANCARRSRALRGRFAAVAVCCSCPRQVGEGNLLLWVLGAQETGVTRVTPGTQQP